VISRLQEIYPTYEFKVFEQDTKGDLILDVPLSKIGDKGLFTKELEDGLKSGAIDFAVHSLKDLPTNLPEGMTVGCIVKRVSPYDVLLVRRDLVEKGITSLKQLSQQKD